MNATRRSSDVSTSRPETRSRVIWRSSGGNVPSRELDDLAAEEPLEIRVGGHPVSVTMRTPGNDVELALGFLLSEAIIGGRDDVRSAAPLTPEGGCNVVEVELADGVGIDLARLTRHVFASSSCGVCGKATIDSIHQQFPKVDAALTLEARSLLDLPRRSREAQLCFDRTGGLHAAAVFDERGELLVLREDVGRHNAVDKAIGYGLREGLLPFDRHVLLVSGRSSFEIMQKALSARIPIVAAISAPSSLAVEFAAASNQTLVGFLRDGRMNIYTGESRIRFDD